MSEDDRQKRAEKVRETADRVRRLGDRDLWDLEDSERERIGRYVPLNAANPDHVLLIALRDEHARRKGNGGDD